MMWLNIELFAYFKYCKQTEQFEKCEWLELHALS